MNYRDERDALRGRIEGLEEDLQDARRMQQDDASKRARIEQIEARMRETEENLRAMRAELAAMGVAPKPSPQVKNPAALIAIVAGVLLAALGMGATVFLVRAAPPKPPPQFVNVEPVPAPVPIPEMTAEEPMKPPPPVRQVKAQWIGKATRIQGLSGGPGTPCVIDATFESALNEGKVIGLSVKCNDKIVYDSEDKLEGMSMLNYGMAEEPGKEAGTFAYAVKYSDTGARSGPRTQISIDTTHGQGAVWSEVVPIFRVDFSVPTLSAPLKGEALLPAKK